MRYINLRFTYLLLLTSDRRSIPDLKTVVTYTCLASIEPDHRASGQAICAFPVAGPKT